MTVRVNESVGLWVDVHLEVYVSKCDNIRPLCGALSPVDSHLFAAQRQRGSP